LACRPKIFPKSAFNSIILFSPNPIAKGPFQRRDLVAPPNHKPSSDG
jgi:hypothetical protein